jgi:hypothetical protein
MVVLISHQLLYQTIMRDAQFSYNTAIRTPGFRIYTANSSLQEDRDATCLWAMVVASQTLFISANLRYLGVRDENGDTPSSALHIFQG